MNDTIPLHVSRGGFTNDWTQPIGTHAEGAPRDLSLCSPLLFHSLILFHFNKLVGDISFTQHFWDVKTHQIHSCGDVSMEV